jgi:hypothetical protein
MYKNKSYCLDCGKQISFISTRCLPCANIKNSSKRMKNRNYKGKNNPKWKGGWKNFLPNCQKCGRKLTSSTAKKCSKCYLEWVKTNIKYFKFKNRQGKNNANWKGGISFLPYSRIWTKSYKHILRKKYNYKCVLCNKIGNPIHHIDYNKKNCKEDNLVLLCRSCHAKTNGNRDYWYAYFTYIKRS